MKKLYKSEDDKVLGGVIGGIAEYYNINSIVLRLVFIFLTIATKVFAGVIVYFIAFFVIPDKPHGNTKQPEDGKKEISE